jgi:hypothetical protein
MKDDKDKGKKPKEEEKKPVVDHRPGFHRSLLNDYGDTSVRLLAQDPPRQSKMGAMNKLEMLTKEATELDETQLTQALDFVRQLKLDEESEAWQDLGLADQAARLAELEADIPKEEVEAWLQAFREVGKPVRWDPEREELVEI